MAHDNSAASNSVGSVTKIPNNRGDKTPSPIVLKGTQLVHKFNSTVPDTVHIFLAVFRVKEKNADLVLSMNVPIETPGGDMGDVKYKQAQNDFEIAVKSLHISDFSLFI